MSGASQLKEFRIADAKVIYPNATPEREYVLFNAFDGMCDAQVEYPDPHLDYISKPMFFNLHMADEALALEEQNQEARELLLDHTTKFRNMRGATLPQIQDMVVNGPAYVVLEEQCWKGVSVAARSTQNLAVPSTIAHAWVELQEKMERAERMIEQGANYLIWYEPNTIFLAVQDGAHLGTAMDVLLRAD